MIREALHLIRQENHQSISMLKAKSLTPSIRKPSPRCTLEVDNKTDRKHNQIV